MSATDVFSWLPDFQGGFKMKYRFDTVVNTSETGNDISRSPLYDKPKRTLSMKMFSPAVVADIENFLRQHHADFFQVLIPSEPIAPVPGAGQSWGDNIKTLSLIAASAGLGSYFNLSFASKAVLVDLKNQNHSELHTLSSFFDIGIQLGEAITSDFYLGNTVIYPVFPAYGNQFSDTLTTPALEDTDLIFEEYY